MSRNKHPCDEHNRVLFEYMSEWLWRHFGIDTYDEKIESSVEDGRRSTQIYLSVAGAELDRLHESGLEEELADAICDDFSGLGTVTIIILRDGVRRVRR
jgi:hypothetical protein